MPDFLIALLASLAVTIVLLPFARRAGDAWSLHAYPSSDRWHTLPIPNTGGIAMVVAVIGGVWLSGAMILLAPIILAATLMFTLGLIDDAWPQPPWVKLTVQVLAAALVLMLLPPIAISGWRGLDVAIALGWIVGLTNAINLIDNIDGLAGGVVAIAASGLLAALWIASGPALPGLPLLLAATAGTTAGFLTYNFPPARIFMGNSGSYLLGVLIGTSTLLTATSIRPASGGLVVAALVLAVPLLDTIFVTVMRGLARRSAFHGGRDHVSHRLAALGFGDRDVVLTLYALSMAGGAAAFGVLLWPSSVASWAVAGLFLAAVLIISLVLAHVPVDRPAAPIPFPGELLSRYLPHAALLDGLLLTCAYATAYVIRFREPELSGFLPHFVRSLPIVVGLQLAALWIAGAYRGALGVPGTRTLLQGSFFGVIASVVAMVYFARFEGYSRLVFAFDAMLAPVFLIASRTLLAALDRMLHLRRSGGRGAIIYGAGRAGAIAARELRRNPEIGLAPIGFLDDDPSKRWMSVEGLGILGPLDALPTLLDRRAGRIAAIVLSIDTLGPDKRDALFALCEQRGIELRQVHFSLEQVAQRRAGTSEVIGFPARSGRRPSGR
jgi:UDP-GlcNAc:undecaprenyl-phosphate GlcNAc-1-phosphate transferase